MTTQIYGMVGISANLRISVPELEFCLKIWLLVLELNFTEFLFDTFRTLKVWFENLFVKHDLRYY